MGQLGNGPAVRMKAGKGCEVASWSEPIGYRLTAATGDLSDDRWTPFCFEFTPENDGELLLLLMGRGFRSNIDNSLVPIWTYTDNVQVDGAEVINGGFEEIGPNGMPIGWTASGAPLVVRDGSVAAEGKCCVKTWHDGRMTQRLKASAGKPVTIRCLVRGEPLAGTK
jgi:hypothetical protein